MSSARDKFGGAARAYTCPCRSDVLARATNLVRVADVDSLVWWKVADVDSLVWWRVADVDSLVWWRVADVDSLGWWRVADVDSLVWWRVADVDSLGLYSTDVLARATNLVEVPPQGGWACFLEPAAKIASDTVFFKRLWAES